jgi:hypothetical protein
MENKSLNAKLSDNLNILINVYKQNYKNAPGGGLGDFIRGCFFLLQISMMNDKRFDIDYSQHPISKYLYKKYIVSESVKIDYDNILYYYPDNYNPNNYNFENTNKFLNELYKYININNITDQFAFFCNNYPIYKITNIQKNIIRDKFLPNEELEEYINLNMNKLNLTPNCYSIIHIRVDDKAFYNTNYIKKNTNLIKQIIKKIKLILFLNHNYQKNKYLLLSNSNYLKNIIIKKFPFIIINLNNISHLAQSTNDNSIKDTLCDFFLMSKSNNIYAFSTYGHGTGFSKYCSIIFNINYYFSHLQ